MGRSVPSALRHFAGIKGGGLTMCAIAGILKYDQRERVERSRLGRMAEVQRHRGPDGGGLWIDGPVGLAHRRLAIIDVSGGHQPMTNEDDSSWIVFNGEIYNYRELQKATAKLFRNYPPGAGKK